MFPENSEKMCGSSLSPSFRWGASRPVVSTVAEGSCMLPCSTGRRRIGIPLEYGSRSQTASHPFRDFGAHRFGGWAAFEKDLSGRMQGLHEELLQPEVVVVSGGPRLVRGAWLRLLFKWPALLRRTVCDVRVAGSLLPLEIWIRELVNGDGGQDRCQRSDAIIPDTPAKTSGG